MAKSPKPARRHHYVPMLLLRRFSTAGKGKKLITNVFDKWTNRIFTPPIDKIMVESDFNIAELSDFDLDFENVHSSAETRAAPHLAKVVEKKSLTDLSDDARLEITAFVTLQFMRAPERRAQFGDLNDAIDQRVQQLVAESSKRPERHPGETPKNAALLMIMKSFPEFMSHFWNKDMFLLGSAPGTEFLIGDSPVVLHNDNDFGAYGNLGIGVPGIQITLPIASDLALAFWCPSLRGAAQESVAKMEKVAKQAQLAVLRPIVAAVMRAHVEAAQEPMKRLSKFLHLTSGAEPFPSTAENMEHLNSLQVITATRFIVSKSGDFSFAKKVVSENENLRRGRRIRFD